MNILNAVRIIMICDVNVLNKNGIARIDRCVIGMMKYSYNTTRININVEEVIWRIKLWVRY